MAIPTATTRQEYWPWRLQHYGRWLKWKEQVVLWFGLFPNGHRVFRLRCQARGVLRAGLYRKTPDMSVTGSPVSFEVGSRCGCIALESNWSQGKADRVDSILAFRRLSAQVLSRVLVSGPSRQLPTSESILLKLTTTHNGTWSLWHDKFDYRRCQSQRWHHSAR